MNITANINQSTVYATAKMVAAGSPRTLLPVQKLPTRGPFLFHGIPAG